MNARTDRGDGDNPEEVSTIEIHGVAARYFEQVVGPAVRELIDELNGREGYEAGEHGHEPVTMGDSSVAEVHGIYIVYPGGTRKHVSVCWPVDSEQVLIGVAEDGRHDKLLDLHDMDKEKLKGEIREMIDVTSNPG